MADYIWTGASSSVYATAGNWTPSGPPATTGDTATFEGRMVASVTGGDQSATTLNVLRQTAKTGGFVIGTATLPLKIKATVAEFGTPAGDGGTYTPGEASIDLSTAQSTITVYATAQQGTSGLAPLLLKGTHASNAITVLGGTTAIAEDAPGAVATMLTTNVFGGSLTLGAGCTLTTINQLASPNLNGGYIWLKAAATTINQEVGTILITGSGAITTINANGQVNHQGTGTVTTLNVQDKGVVNFDGTLAAITVTNCNVYGDGKIIDSNKRVVWTNGIIGAQGANTKNILVTSPFTATIT